MKTIFISFALVLVSVPVQARMICAPRPPLDLSTHHFTATEQPGGTCGQMPWMIKYAKRNGSNVLDYFYFGGAVSKLSNNKCVETIEGIAFDGYEWTATESWSRDGNYMFGYYKVKRDSHAENCESEYVVKAVQKVSP